MSIELTEMEVNPTQSVRSMSERQEQLLQLYRQVHRDGFTSKGIAAAQAFDGRSLLDHIEKIKDLIVSTGSLSLLDYGCGKAKLHFAEQVVDKHGKSFGRLHDYWGLSSVSLYDPAVDGFSELPTGPFDAVICTDVLEHCPEEDIDRILDEIFSRARKCVYANVASYAAAKILPNGENAHCTVKPPDWWREKVSIAAAGRKVTYHFTVELRAHDDWRSRWYAKIPVLKSIAKKSIGNRFREIVIKS